MILNADKVAEFVTPEAAELYLRAHGWTPERENELFSSWSRNGGEITHLFVPRSSEPADYSRRLYDFVAKLSQVENRGIETVVTNLRYAAADVVRVRLESPSVHAGEVPIGEGAALFEGTRKLMVAAACAAFEPRPHYGPRKPAVASDYIQGVRLGQTERGSYVVTVISDLSWTAQETLLPDGAPPPFERQVTETLATALASAKGAARAVLDEFHEVAIFEEVVEVGVSANLCDALAEIGAHDEVSRVRVTFDWSASWQLPDQDDTPDVSFDLAELEVVERAAAYLRHLGPFEGVEVRGFVRHLDRGTADAVGTIIIEGMADGERRNVHVELAPDAYREAIDAHEERQEVSIKGTLAKEGRHWVLRPESRLEIVRGF